jgi:predicted HAD superfamily Cof-like phosphohydrolase
MTNPFQDQRTFMEACGQTTDDENRDQYKLYLDLIEEEVQELRDSTTPESDLDALIDIMVVTIGAIYSMGADPKGAWDEVIRTNMAKININTGRVDKDNTGKVLKPEGWTPPVLKPYLHSNHQ